MIKAIETKYKGYRFRSRLEARWAVFFDVLGISWEYEPEGFDLGVEGWYLPDFKIFTNQCSAPAWFEVKGKKATKTDIRKLEALCSGTGLHGFIASGTMGTPDIKTARKGRVDFSGAVILHRAPTDEVQESFSVNLDESTKQGLKAYYSAIESMAIHAFYEDSEGRVCIDNVYDRDTEQGCDLTKKSDDFLSERFPVEIVKLVNIARDTGSSFWMVNKVLEDLSLAVSFNTGSGRFYRSRLIKSAYEKARSARFEHGETP